MLLGRKLSLITHLRLLPICAIRIGVDRVPLLIIPHVNIPLRILNAVVRGTINVFVPLAGITIPFVLLSRNNFLWPGNIVCRSIALAPWLTILSTALTCFRRGQLDWLPSRRLTLGTRPSVLLPDLQCWTSFKSRPLATEKQMHTLEPLEMAASGLGRSVSINAFIWQGSAFIILLVGSPINAHDKPPWVPILRVPTRVNRVRVVKREPPVASRLKVEIIPRPHNLRPSLHASRVAVSEVPVVLMPVNVARRVVLQGIRLTTNNDRFCPICLFLSIYIRASALSIRGQTLTLRCLCTAVEHASDSAWLAGVRATIPHFDLIAVRGVRPYLAVVK